MLVLIALIGLAAVVRLAMSDSEADCIQYVYSHGEPIGCLAKEKP